MYTIDASVHVSALNPSEADSADSRAFLTQVYRHGVALFCPTLLPVEVAAAVSRSLDDSKRAAALAMALRDWHHLTLVPLDEGLLAQAVELATSARLRGADAVYAVIAQQYGTTLVTIDRQQLERLGSLITVARPGDALRAGG